MMNTLSRDNRHIADHYSFESDCPNCLRNTHYSLPMTTLLPKSRIFILQTHGNRDPVFRISARDYPVGAADNSQNRRIQRNLKELGHLIVIYQENWSFDSLYGQFPGANSFDMLPQLDVKANPPYSSLIY